MQNKPTNKGKNQYKNSLYQSIDTGYDKVVLPSDVYRESSSTMQNLFGIYDYLPFVEVGELEHLNALITNSASAQSIISKLATYTVGEGFYVKPYKTVLGDKQSIKLTDEQKAILYKVLTRKNTHNDDILEVAKKAAFDYCAFGNAFAQLDIVESSGSSFVFCTHKQTNFVRPFRSLDLVTRFYGVSLDWASIPLHLQGISNGRRKAEEINARQLNSDVYNVAAYPTFDGEEIKTSMLHVKNYSPQMYFWGLPDWMAAKHWIELEYRIAKFNVSRFKNGLTPSGILQVFGDLTEEESKQYLDDMKSKFTNTGNDFKVIFQVLSNPDLKANWQSFEQTYAGYFMELANLCKEFISVGFSFPLALMQAQSGQLGNNQQIRSEFEILYNTKIYAIQEAIIGGIVKPYLDTVAENEGLDFLKGVELGFKNIVPVSFAGDMTVDNLLTTNEGRELLGYEEREGGDMIISEREVAVEAVTEEPKQGGIMNRIYKIFKR
jgi:hypothetical protein